MTSESALHCDFADLLDDFPADCRCSHAHPSHTVRILGSKLALAACALVALQTIFKLYEGAKERKKSRHCERG
eukprot:1529601-Rhodomonas_salina.3